MCGGVLDTVCDPRGCSQDVAPLIEYTHDLLRVGCGAGTCEADVTPALRLLEAVEPALRALCGATACEADVEPATELVRNLATTAAHICEATCTSFDVDDALDLVDSLSGMVAPACVSICSIDGRSAVVAAIASVGALTPGLCPGVIRCSDAPRLASATVAMMCGASTCRVDARSIPPLITATTSVIRALCARICEFDSGAFDTVETVGNLIGNLCDRSDCKVEADPVVNLLGSTATMLSTACNGGVCHVDGRGPLTTLNGLLAGVCDSGHCTANARPAVDLVHNALAAVCGLGTCTADAEGAISSIRSALDYVCPVANCTADARPVVTATSALLASACGLGACAGDLAPTHREIEIMLARVCHTAFGCQVTTAPLINDARELLQAVCPTLGSCEADARGAVASVSALLDSTCDRGGCAADAGDLFKALRLQLVNLCQLSGGACSVSLGPALRDVKNAIDLVCRVHPCTVSTQPLVDQIAGLVAGVCPGTSCVPPIDPASSRELPVRRP